jgi:hypothetical protein
LLVAGDLFCLLPAMYFLGPLSAEIHHMVMVSASLNQSGSQRRKGIFSWVHKQLNFSLFLSTIQSI